MKKEDIQISIDRLTILSDSSEVSPVKLFKNLKKHLHREVARYPKLEIIDYDNNSFGVKFEKLNDYDKVEFQENLIFIQLFYHGSEVDLRIDFNPNSLIKRDAEGIWSSIKYFLDMARADLRLSRFDLAFDIYDYPEIQNMVNLKGGITRKVFYGRSGALETTYWGSQASNIQIRLYDKLAEIDAEKGDYEALMRPTENLWRLEMQMRTKVINDKLVDEVLSRLEYFSLTDPTKLGLSEEMTRFAIMYFERSSDLAMLYPSITDRQIRNKKAQVRKAVLENQDEVVLEIKKALERDTLKLRTELKKYVDIYLGF